MDLRADLMERYFMSKKLRELPSQRDGLTSNSTRSIAQPEGRQLVSLGQRPRNVFKPQFLALKGPNPIALPSVPLTMGLVVSEDKPAGN
jgi:hypothetical protein